MTTDENQLGGWAALADTLTAARTLEKLVMKGSASFSRNALRDAVDRLADELSSFMDTLAADPEDVVSLSTPMLPRAALTDLRGQFIARWKAQP